LSPRGCDDYFRVAGHTPGNGTGLRRQRRYLNCVLYNLFMDPRTTLLKEIGGEAGCRRLSAEFYGRVGNDPVLRPIFPGKSLRCAIEEFSAFLIQFLGGDEEQTQYRWWLSLRESHARFPIGLTARSAWLKHMGATLEAAPLDEGTRKALRQFFLHSSAYVIGKETAGPEHEELAARWDEQRVLDDAIAAIAAGLDDEATVVAPRFVSRPSVFVGLMARMVKSGRARLIGFVVDAVERDASLATRRFGGRTLLHYAAGAGCREVAASVIRHGIAPDIPDSGGHTPLYRVANECASETGPEVVLTLVRAGADVNARNGVTRATALHMAARRGYAEIARALLDCGAAIEARDKKGDTPLQRAINCRKDAVVQLLVERGATRAGKLGGQPRSAV
jgi:hemoglobin